MEMIDALSEETALATIRNPKNRRRRVWTATILLNRMGINRGPVSYEKWSKANRLKARTILDALWKKGLIVRAVSPDTRNKYLAPHEIAYKRVEDAPAVYLVACPSCGAPCLCRRQDGKPSVAPCPECGTALSKRGSAPPGHGVH
jgi:hypothetical protein